MNRFKKEELVLNIILGGSSIILALGFVYLLMAACWGDSKW